MIAVQADGWLLPLSHMFTCLSLTQLLNSCDWKNLPSDVSSILEWKDVVEFYSCLIFIGSVNLIDSYGTD